jgi:NTP pyrophosphatase (non-canonical NTP hydrolase)
MIDLKELQDRIYANKEAKGFNTTNIELEFNCTYGELAEAWDAHIKHKTDVGEELADVMIYLLSLARMLKVDLEGELLAKLDKNHKRTYTEHTINGHRVRLKDSHAEEHGHASRQHEEGEHHV